MKQISYCQTLALLIALSFLGGAACSTSNTKAENAALTEQVQSEPPANSPEEIRNRAASVFADAPGLTNDQKQKLETIYQRTYAEAMAIRAEIGQSKSLLFKTVSKSDYKSNEVDRLKKRIVELDQKRLNIMFKALADVQAIVGYGADKEEIYERLRDYEYPRGRVLTGQQK